jgi:hypothetical protein
MSDQLKEIAERLEDHAEPANQDVAHLLAVLYVMERDLRAMEREHEEAS